MPVCGFVIAALTGAAELKLAALVTLICTFAHGKVVTRARPPGAHIAVRKLRMSVAVSVVPALAAWNCPV